MRFVAPLLLLVGCATDIPLGAERTIAALRAWHLQRDPEALSRVRIYPVPHHPDLVAAICDYQDEWWGFFGVYCVTAGMVDWQANIETEPEEQAIHQLRVLHLPGFTGPIFEVLGITHMGNGNLYLYEFQGRKLNLLLETHAVDFNPDTLQFRGGRLESTYRDLDGDGSIDLLLSGTIEDWGEKGESLLSSRPCRQVFLWKHDQRRFVEDLTRQEGFSGYLR